jgi:hypothetical protein
LTCAGRACVFRCRIGRVALTVARRDQRQRRVSAGKMTPIVWHQMRAENECLAACITVPGANMVDTCDSRPHSKRSRLSGTPSPTRRSHPRTIGVCSARMSPSASRARASTRIGGRLYVAMSNVRRPRSQPHRTSPPDRPSQTAPARHIPASRSTRAAP